MQLSTHACFTTVQYAGAVPAPVDRVSGSRLQRLLAQMVLSIRCLCQHSARGCAPPQGAQHIQAWGP